MSLRYGLHEQVYFKQLQAAPAQQGEAAAAAGGKELDSQQKLSAGQPEGVHQAVTAGVSGQPVDPGSDADVHLPPLVDDGSSQIAEQVAETSQLGLWAAHPEATSFTAPSSRCTLHPNSEFCLHLRFEAGRSKLDGWMELDVCIAGDAMR
jgi:hypothetical protein